MRHWFIVLVCGSLAAAAGFQPAGSSQQVGTPVELVATYSSLADSILATKATEASLVRSIVAMTYRHAEVLEARTQGKLKAGESATHEIEMLADLVSQLGNEGDAAVAGIRKRLLDGGHHHHAGGEQQGVYDKGFVVVTRKARKALLETAGKIARMASGADAGKLAEAWGQVTETCAVLLKAR